MNVLVLDDDSDRHEGFDRQYRSDTVVHVWTVAEALDALNQVKFDVAQLDHDLNDFSKTPSYGDGVYGGARAELTGYDVARHIAREMEESARPDLVIVHSVNPVGARAMMNVLRDAEIKCFYSPY